MNLSIEWWASTPDIFVPTQDIFARIGLFPTKIQMLILEPDQQPASDVCVTSPGGACVIDVTRHCAQSITRTHIKHSTPPTIKRRNSPAPYIPFHCRHAFLIYDWRSPAKIILNLNSRHYLRFNFHAIHHRIDWKSQHVPTQFHCQDNHEIWERSNIPENIPKVQNSYILELHHLGTLTLELTNQLSSEVPALIALAWCQHEIK